jgi:toxin ParE1/3/4
VASVRRSALAERDLLEVWSHIAKDSPSAADHFLDLIGEKCDLLAASPDMGRRREELAPALRSFPVGRYVIFYRLGERGIQVVRVLSAYRDIAAIFGPP